MHISIATCYILLYYELKCILNILSCSLRNWLELTTTDNSVLADRLWSGERQVWQYWAVSGDQYRCLMCVTWWLDKFSLNIEHGIPMMKQETSTIRLPDVSSFFHQKCARYLAVTVQVQCPYQWSYLNLQPSILSSGRDKICQQQPWRLIVLVNIKSRKYR